MNRKVWAVLIGLALIGQGCSPYTEEKAYRDVHRKLSGIETYSCTADIYIKGNKEPGRFITRQWFCMPDKYRLEVLEPEVMRGKTTVSDGQRLWMYYPYIDQVLLLEDMDSSMDESMFIGFFLRDMLETESIDYSIREEDGTTTVVVELPVPGSSKYRFTQRLFMDKKRLCPVLLEIYDINGQVTTRVEYSDFEYNPALDSDFFDKDKITISMLYEEWDTSGMFFDSMDEARKYLDFPPLGMQYTPAGFERDVIQVVKKDDQYTLVAAFSDNRGQTITLLQKVAAKGAGEFHDGGELIYLNDKQAVYSQIQDIGKISWTEGGIRVELMGNLTRGNLMEIARSIK